MPARRSHWLAAALLVVHVGLSIGSAARKSATFDELPHLTAGYSYWHLNDYRLHPENGILPQRLAAAPLLFDQPSFPQTTQPAWRVSDVWEIGDQFFHGRRNDLDSMLFRGRCMIIGLSVALGLVVYLWSTRLFGVVGGLISLALYALSPTMLAHASLITSDMAAALFLLAATGCFWLQLHRRTWLALLGGALAIALAFTAKMSAVLLAPIGAVLIIVRLAHDRRQWGRIIGVVLLNGLVTVVVIWAMFGFRFAASDPLPRDRFFWDWRSSTATTQPLVKLAAAAADYKLLPEAYLYGFAFVAHHANQRRAFLNGEYSTTGWLHFFPYAMLVKTPIVTLLMIVAGVVLARRRWLDLCPLVVLIAVYMGFAMAGGINIGHRHVLPIYPALFVIAGAAVGQVRWGRGLVLVALIALAGESLYRHPHHLAYFNQIVGGPRNGYKHLVGSSLDWGQDLPALKKYMVEHSDAAPFYLSYYGSGSPRYYNMPVTAMASHWNSPVESWPKPWTGGTYCVSATMLQTLNLRCAGPWCRDYEREYQANRQRIEMYMRGSDEQKRKWAQQRGQDYWRFQIFLYEQLRFARLAAMLRQRTPDDHVGYSILIYRLTDQEVREALDGPPVQLVDRPTFSPEALP